MVRRRFAQAALCCSAALALALSCSEAPLPRREQPDGAAGDASVDGGGTGGSDGGLSAANACALLNARKCEFLQRCGLIAPGPAAARDCASILVTTECGPSLWPSRVAVGTLRFSSAAASACAEGWNGRRCEDFRTPPDFCGQFLSPGSGINGACYGGAFRECLGAVCRGLSCPRTCRAPGTIGEDCGQDGECATDAGLYCLPSGTNAAGSCSPYAQADAGCNALVRCGEGLYCSSGGACAPLRENGESCEEGTCVRSNWCALGQDGGRSCTWRVVTGSGCTDDRQCQEGAICVAQSGKCGSKGPLPVNSACGSRQECANGLSCVGLTSSSLGSCHEPLALGSPCAAATDCEPQLSCVAVDGGSESRCDVRLADGQSCDEHRDCQLYSACKAGSCYRLPRLGDPCSGAECVYGSCTSAADGGDTCSGLLGPNASCTLDAECSSARCVANKCLAACTP